jgi:methylenetetrahydrofolate reductase (NADPH)
MEEDLAHLKQKVAAGADWVITQLFFDNADYFAFVKKVRALGITVPIVPGIMPVTNYAQVRRFTELCAAKIPAEMTQTLETIQNDAEAVVRFGIDYAVRQCKSLIEGGAPGIHFYTLNRTHSTAEILVKLKKQL